MMPSTSELRDRILAACDDAYAGATRSARGVRVGILDAQAAVRDVAVTLEPGPWIACVLAALEQVRLRFVDPRDDDGFELGGVATVRNTVEQVRDELVQDRSTSTDCPACRKPMQLVEKDTSSGRDMRTYHCRACDKDVDMEYGVALWKALSDARDA